VRLRVDLVEVGREVEPVQHLEPAVAQDPLGLVGGDLRRELHVEPPRDDAEAAVGEAHEPAGLVGALHRLGGIDRRGDLGRRFDEHPAGVAERLQRVVGHAGLGHRRGGAEVGDAGDGLAAFVLADADGDDAVDLLDRLGLVPREIRSVHELRLRAFVVRLDPRDGTGTAGGHPRPRPGGKSTPL
jgi:hypothetical protein